MVYRGLCILHPKNADTEPWANSIKDYPLGATSNVETFLGDLQSLGFLVQFAIVIEANVDARAVARKLSKNLEARAQIPDVFCCPIM